MHSPLCMVTSYTTPGSLQVPSMAQWQRTLMRGSAFVYQGPGSLLAQASGPPDTTPCTLITSPADSFPSHLMYSYWPFHCLP